MKMRNKGKVHPFTTSSSSSSSSSSTTDSLSVLKLLPTAILTLVSFLSLEDREVLAYLITRSLSTNPSFFPANEDRKKSSKKQCGHSSPVLFDCDCFHCYTSFWFRWDSSPNRELIHKAIEAFEDHLNSGETLKSNNGKSKRREKFGRRRTEKLGGDTGIPDSAAAAESPENLDRAAAATATEVEATVAEVEEVEPGVSAEEEESMVATEAAPSVEVRTHKGLARKVLPDVMGIFSSRLWSLWSPNV